MVGVPHRPLLPSLPTQELAAESVVVREDGGAKVGVLDPTIDRLTREALQEYDRAHEVYEP